MTVWRSTSVALVMLMCASMSGTSNVSGVTIASQPAQEKAPSPWGDWVERDAPFFSSVLDAGKAGSGLPSRNLTPRALVVRVDDNHWVAFDTELLRVSAMWTGTAVTTRALSSGSYHEADRKTPGGQSPLPEPAGSVWLANGIYPGWQSGAQPTFIDPREPAPSVEEVGRGPLAASEGRFTAVRLARHSVVLEYSIRGTDVREWMSMASTAGRSAMVRNITVGPSATALWLMVGATSGTTTIAACEGSPAPESYTMPSDVGANAKVWALRVPPDNTARQLCLIASESGTTGLVVRPSPVPTTLPLPRWPQEVVTGVVRSTSNEAFVVDDFDLPTRNPWRRNVRPSDIQFLRDGTAFSVTLDGDVWMARGLDTGSVRWRRFASGLHEPMSLAIRDEQIYVFDRNGIWRLRDTNGDDEADVHELFSNAFAQTADMREFPSTIRVAPNGAFVIAKGGQEAATIGKHNGSVLRISADGRTSTVLGYGFRQPQLGVNVRTGLVTASDQQGHYIPSTPLHIVRDRQFYGFLSDKLPREVYPAPIADPLTWIPHSVNASALSQVWLFDAKMGPLTDQMVHIGFNRPELFRVMFNHRGTRPQAAVVSITRDFQFPPLNGSVNPADGQLYIAGFQVLGWGTTSPRLAGLGRVRYTGAPSTLPREVVPMDKGILVRFDNAVDPKRASDPHNYTIASWHYKRSYTYGSPQLKADDTPGSDRLVPSSAYVSNDGRSVFVGIPGMKPVMQMHIGWTLQTVAGTIFQDSASFTPYELVRFDPLAEGFGAIDVDLSPKTEVTAAAGAVSVDEGRNVYERYGCVACHANEANAISRLGPNFKGLYGSERIISQGAVRVIADEPYIRESILEPTKKVVTGFNRTGMGMPSFAGVLTEQQLESLVLYIKSLK